MATEVFELQDGLIIMPDPEPKVRTPIYLQTILKLKKLRRHPDWFPVRLTGHLIAQNGTAEASSFCSFENASKAPGIDWIGEALPKSLVSGSRSGVCHPPQDRIYAFDRWGFQYSAASRALCTASLRKWTWTTSLWQLHL